MFNLVFSLFALANLWLTFSIVIELVPTSVKINLFVTADVVRYLHLLCQHRADFQTHWVNQVLMWIYLAFLMLQVSLSFHSALADFQFVLALGNRPKGERGLYLVTLWVYAVLALYLIVCSVILSIQAFKSALAVDGNIGQKLANLFKETNGILIAAVLSTVGGLNTSEVHSKR